MDPAYRGRDHQRHQFCHSCRNHRTDRLSHTPYRPGNERNGHVRTTIIAAHDHSTRLNVCAYRRDHVWTGYYESQALKLNNARYFEFAFENYTALGYGDALPADGNRLIGPITALNGLLLIGWSIAVIFEVMRMAELRFGRHRKASD